MTFHVNLLQGTSINLPVVGSVSLAVLGVAALAFFILKRRKKSVKLVF